MITINEIINLYENAHIYSAEDDLNDTPVCVQCGSPDLRAIEAATYWQPARFHQRLGAWQIDLDNTDWDSGGAEFDTVGYICANCQYERGAPDALITTLADFIVERGGEPLGHDEAIQLFTRTRNTPFLNPTRQGWTR